MTCGLGVACLVGGVITLALHHLDLLAAGVAGMLALETRASSAVGVAISVTTIPAPAYLGVAAGEGEVSKAAGALAVPGVNVAMLLAAGCLTVLVQRRLGDRRVSERSSDRDDARRS